ncbi:MAG: hypothetical protein DLM54_02855, partial [Acidimicrobiales bacterium]
MAAWTNAETRQFLTAIAGDRLAAVWRIFLTLGPRRGEVAGLRWADIDLDAGRARFVHTLVVVGGKAVESTPKTAAGRRSVPLDPVTVSALRAHLVRQDAERVVAGPLWTETGYVFTREDGQPYHPDFYSNRFDALAKGAGLRRIRLHDARHTAATGLLEDGTPTKVAAELLGHASPTITATLYQHVLPGMTESAVVRRAAALDKKTPEPCRETNPLTSRHPRLDDERDAWVVRGPADGRVESWSVTRLPFEPSGSMLEFRAALRLAVRRLAAEAGPSYRLTGVYSSDQNAFVDTENVLFYNVGTSAFGRPSSIHIERRFDVPPLVPLSGCSAVHHHRYLATEEVPEGGWSRGPVACQWHAPLMTGSVSLLNPAAIWLSVSRVLTVFTELSTDQLYAVKIDVSGMAPRAVV